jgi:hypothetical protein
MIMDIPIHMDKCVNTGTYYIVVMSKQELFYTDLLIYRIIKWNY